MNNRSSIWHLAEYLSDLYLKLKPRKSFQGTFLLLVLAILHELVAKKPLLGLVNGLLADPGLQVENPGWHRFLTILSFMLAESGWWVVALLFVLLFLVAYVMSQQTKGGSFRELEADKTLFQKIISKDMLHPEYITSFIKQRDVGTSFQWSRADPLGEFTEVYLQRSDFEFFDPELEAKKHELGKAASEFLSYMGTNTFSLDGNVLWSKVPDEWRTLYPERYERTITTLECLAETLWKTYEEFVRLGRRKLHAEFQD